MEKKELRENIFEILQERGSYVEQVDKLESLFGQYAAQFQGQQSASNVEDFEQWKLEQLHSLVNNLPHHTFFSDFKNWLALHPTAMQHISQLFSNSEPVSNLHAELQLLRERLEAAEKVLLAAHPFAEEADPELHRIDFIAADGYAWLDKWQQLKQQSK